MDRERHNMSGTGMLPRGRDLRERAAMAHPHEERDWESVTEAVWAPLRATVQSLFFKARATQAHFSTLHNVII